jgi:hypothetical protein
MNNEPVAWTVCVGCGQRITGDSIHTCSPQLKELDAQFKKGFEAGKEEGWKAHKFHHPAKTLTDEEILREAYYILMREQQRKAQEK